MTPTSIISLCFSGIMMVIGVSTFIITQVCAGKQDTSESVNRFANMENTLTEVRVSLDEVRKTVTETRQDVKNLSTNIIDIDRRLTRAEEQLATAFIRIDELRETKVDKVQ